MYLREKSSYPTFRWHMDIDFTDHGSKGRFIKQHKEESKERGRTRSRWQLLSNDILILFFSFLQLRDQIP